MDPALILSVVALAAGPFVGGTGRESDMTQRLLERFVVVVVAGLVLLHILPHGFALCGWPAVLAVVLGLVIPVVAHQALHGQGRERKAVLAIAVVALGVHATLDGVSLAGRGHEHAGGFTLLAVAVVLHRFPVAIAIWWMTRPVFGASIAVAVLTMVGVATVGGYALAGSVFGPESQWTMGMVQAAMGGALLHVVAHHGPRPHDATSRPPRWPDVAGATAGCAVLLGIVAAEVAQGEPYGALRMVAAVAITLFALRRPRAGSGHHHSES